MTAEQSSSQLLLIEDDPVICKLLITALLAENIELTTTNTLAGGKSKINQKIFDLIIVDLSLPDSEGIATAREIIAMCPKIPVIVFTGYLPLEDSTLLIKEGAKDFILKGEMKLPDMVQRIKSAIVSGAAMKEAIESLAPLTEAVKVLETFK